MKRLDEIEARVNAATEGPWEAEHHHHRQTGAQVVSEVHPTVECEGGGGGGTHRSEDAEFIAHARQDVPALVAALRAVLRVHYKSEGVRWVGFSRADEDQHYCMADQEAWPCPTVTAIRQQLGEEEASD